MATSRNCMIASLLIVLLQSEVHGGRVLGFFEYPGRSHFVMFEALMKDLAAKGHQVTVVSHFPQKTPITNYTDVSLAGSVPLLGKTVEQIREYTISRILHYFWSDSWVVCKKALEYPAVKNLLGSGVHFDLVVSEYMGADCGSAVAWKFRAPLIVMTSLTRLPNEQYRMGFLESPVYFPVWSMPFSVKMNLWQRVTNTFWWLYSVIGERLVMFPMHDKIIPELLGSDIPPLEELHFNTSLVFINSHFSLNGVLPSLPSVVEVGGMHISPTEDQLSTDLRMWLEESELGVVYVSFGSLTGAEDMPLHMLSAMVQVLGALPQRVVWKCNETSVTGRLGLRLPENIYTAAWMPQGTILSHPKVRVFVSHGGLMGSQESVFWGKPMVVIPFFSDQFQNALNLVDRGMAVQLEYEEFNEENFGTAIRTIINDPRYEAGARMLSKIFRDRPISPRQEAVYWSEYVMRHRGAPHMRPASQDLWWWQHWMLDIVVIGLVVCEAIVTMIFLVVYALRSFYVRYSSTKVKKS